MKNVAVVDIDLAALLAGVEAVCAHCDAFRTPACAEARCLAGFARKVLKFAIERGVWDIPGASRLLPLEDFKPYYPEQVAPALAETLRQCRQCRDNHSPDCVVALVRTAMESALLQENIAYPGSVFLYLAKIKEQHPELARLLAEAFRNPAKPPA